MNLVVISRLRSTPLVLWDDRRKGYTIDPTLRHIIGEHIYRHNPTLYAKVNRYAIDVYRDWIVRAGDNRAIYIVEELYQQACANRVLEDTSPKDRIEIENLLKKRIDEYQQGDPDLRALALDRLYHELEEDFDFCPF